MKNLRYFLPLLLGGILTLPLLITSCNPDDESSPGALLVEDFDAEASLRWNLVFLEVERYAAGYRPGPAPRALAHLGLAAYEACVTGMPGYNSLESRYVGLDIPDVEDGKEYYWPEVINGVYSRMMP